LDSGARSGWTQGKPAVRRPLRPVVEGVGAVIEERPPPREGGVADQEVDASQRLECLSDDALARGALEAVAFDEHRLATQRLDFGDDGLGLRGAFAIVDSDVGPSTGQPQGATTAHAAGGAGDQSLLAK